MKQLNDYRETFFKNRNCKSLNFNYKSLIVYVSYNFIDDNRLFIWSFEQSDKRQTKTKKDIYSSHDNPKDVIPTDLSIDDLYKIALEKIK